MTTVEARLRRALIMCAPKECDGEYSEGCGCMYHVAKAALDGEVLPGPFEAQVEIPTPIPAIDPPAHPLPAARRERLPTERAGVTRKLVIHAPDGPIEMYAIVGTYADGRPGELFLKLDRAGSLASGLADGFSLVVSLALQHGVPLPAITGKLRHGRFEPSGTTGDPEQPIASSLLDLLAGWMERRFGDQASSSQRP